MVLRALPGSAGYMFASWPAAPPVFEAVARPASGRLRVPLIKSQSEQVLQSSAPIPIGTPLTPPSEAAPAVLAPVSGRAVGWADATLTTGRAVRTLEFEPTQDADPIWTAYDDVSGLELIRRVEPAQLVEWIERFRSAGLSAERHTSPDLLTQLQHSSRRPIDTVLCSVLDVDPSACLSASLAAAYGIELAAGVMLVARIARAGRAIVAVDARVPAPWLSSLRNAARGSLRIESMVNDYPQADPTLMLYTFLGRRLRPGRLPSEMGVIQLDTPAAVMIGRCALQGAMALSVPLAVRDHALGQTFFLFAPVGMRVADVLAQARIPQALGVVRGGDVLRDVRLTDDAVVSAAGELVLHASPKQRMIPPDPCVRCGWCAEACPTRLLPAGVLEAAQAEDLDLAEHYGVDACIECGICTYVCPSRLPLLESVRRVRALRDDASATPTTAPARKPH